MKIEMGLDQCDQIWRNFATLANIQKALGNFERRYLVFDKILSLLWPKNHIGQIFIALKGQILSK